ncbi:riboflavin synthase [Adlercreutzia murintestinalis]|uniref:riboflavin synthase n=1 Tax=Adlercreutzia murintestinalis TaxID=2941325 RepID=UPI00203C6086|nr:riboflavin synthase [Adlercreutzia murintestinalis]
MFTGIVEEVGSVERITPGARSATIALKASTVVEGTKLGDSISVNGVCLTVTDLSASGFMADAMPETLTRTDLGQLRPGSPVNLERALRLSDRLGGHLVSGHIDGTARIASFAHDDNAVRIRIADAAHLTPLIVEKGSVALDGISLTVTAVDAATFEVSVIPHTFAHTNLCDKRVGDALNVECDIIGKYIEKLMGAQESSGITMDFLVQNGF